MTQYEDTRTDKRKPVNIEVEFKGIRKSYKAVTHNLSLGGMFVATRKPLAKTNKAFFKLKAGEKSLNFHLEGEVVWNNGRGCEKNRKDFPPGMGIKFLDSRILSKSAIKNFVSFIEESSFKVCV